MHDLIRLGLSLATAARDSVLPGLATAGVMGRLVVGYESGLVRQTKKERKSIEQAFGGKEGVLNRLVPEAVHWNSRVDILDAASWVKGCSSLGTLRYVVLLKTINSDSGDERHCLIDIKEALHLTAPAQVDVIMPPVHAKRVLEGAQRLSPYFRDALLLHSHSILMRFCLRYE